MRSQLISAVLFLASFSSALALVPGAPYGVDFVERGDSILVIWFCQGVNQHSYLNDYNETEDYFIVAEQYLNNRAAAQFQNARGDFPIASISLFLWGYDLQPEMPGGPTSPFGLSILSTLPNDTSTTPLWGEDTVAATLGPAQGAWHEFRVAERLPIDDSCYVQMRWLPETPAAPLLGVDHQNGITTTGFYGYLQENILRWKNFSGGTFLIRLNYNLPDTLPETTGFGAGVDSFAVFVTLDSAEVLEESQPAFVVKDSLHVVLSAAALSGHYLTVAACYLDQIGPRSKPEQVTGRPWLPFPVTFEPESLNVVNETGVISKRIVRVINLSEIEISVSVAEMAPPSEWLEIDRYPIPLAAGATAEMSFTIDNRMLSPSIYDCLLIFACSSACCDFPLHEFQVRNQVDISTDSRIGEFPAQNGTLMQQNSPNPFNESTLIQSTSAAPIEIYDLLGCLVSIIETPIVAGQGRHLFLWDGRSDSGSRLPSGIYFYRQQGAAAARKMLLLK